jgi:RHS repeat-associated protein
VILPTVYDPQAQQYVPPTTTYVYDAYGDMTTMTDAKGRTRQFAYDAFGHELSRTLPLGQVETTTYDAYGREATFTDFKGQEEVIHYDSLGRNDTKTFYAAGSNTPGETVVYHFDSLDRNDTVTDTIGSTQRVTQYGYDLDNRVTSITTPEGTVNYVFDPATGRHTETWTANSDVLYGYDQLGRVQTVTVTKQKGVTLNPSLVTTYYYTKFSALDHVTYPNGTETDYTYDVLNRVTNVTNKKGSTLLSSYAYTLEADGLRTAVSEQQLESDGTYSTETKTWTYDSLQRLSQEVYTTTISPATNNYTTNYSYDLVGNRLSETTVQAGNTTTVTSSYNNNDQLTSDSGTLNGSSSWQTTYSYDSDGSLTSLTRTGANAQTATYGYDLQNRMTTANVSRSESGQSLTIAASYTHDNSGPRAQGVVTTTIGSGSPTTTTTQYLVDANNPTGYSQVLEEHTNGSTTPRLSYLIGLTVFGQTDGSGNTRYLMPDVEGSTRLVADPTGTIVARFAYDAYGNLLGTTIGVVNPPVTRILYTGQQFDLSLLQYYLRARYYDPVTGRFAASDPLREAASDQDLYRYAADNPIFYVDPSGLQLSGEMLAAMGVQTTARGTQAPAVFYVMSFAINTSLAIRIGSTILLSMIALTTTAAVTVTLLQTVTVTVTITDTTVDTEECNCTPIYDYFNRDLQGRATGASAQFSRPQIGTGSEFWGHPGWWYGTGNLPVGPGEQVGRVWDGAHLIAKRLGGEGRSNYSNQVPLYSRVNQVIMRTGVESYAAALALEGQCVRYLVFPVYSGRNYYPDSLIVTVASDQSVSTTVQIVNIR